MVRPKLVYLQRREWREVLGKISPLFGRVKKQYPALKDRVDTMSTYMRWAEAPVITSMELVHLAGLLTPGDRLQLRLKKWAGKLARFDRVEPKPAKKKSGR